MDKTYVVVVRNGSATFTAVVKAEDEARATFLAGYIAGAKGPDYVSYSVTEDADVANLNMITVDSVTEADENTILPEDEPRMSLMNLLSALGDGLKILDLSDPV